MQDTQSSFTGIGNFLNNFRRLSFPDANLEAKFQQFYNDLFLGQTRVAMGMAIILIFLDALVDHLYSPAKVSDGNFIRYIVNGLFLLMLLGTMVKALEKYMQTFVCISFSITGCLLLYSLYVIELAGGNGLAAWTGVLNHFFLVVFSFLIMGLRVPAGLIAGTTITACFLSLIYYGGFLKQDFLFAYSTYHIITVWILGIYLGLERERYIRKDFMFIHERTERQKELSKAKNEAEKANRAKSDFLALMSHELRTPMNGILGMTQVALAKETTDPETKETFQTIKNSGETLKRIINNILDITRIEMGVIKVQKEDFSLKLAVNEVTDMLTSIATERGLSLSTKFGKMVPEYIHSDPALHKQILMNLVGNAIKFTNEGSIHIACKCLEETRDGVKLQISVSDTGIGIPEKEQATIFETMKQGSNSNGQEGTGLGLAIVKRLVGELGGKISITSQLGKGSTITYEIPVQTVDNPEIQISQPTTPEHMPPLKQLSILLVEDDEINQKVARQLLELEGHHVTIAGSGEEAISITKNKNFDIILMDFRLPDMKGTEVTKIILSNRKTSDPDTPIIALTANVMPEEIETYLEAGMQAVIAKPIDAEKLSEALRKNAPQKTKLNGRSTSPVIPDLFDESQLETIMQSFSREQFIDLANQFINSISTTMEELEKSLDNSKMNDLDFYAHKLAGAAINFALPRLHECASDLQNKVKDQDITSISLATNSLHTEVEQTCTALSQFIENYR